MNKLTLAMNVWRAYTAARRTEGSSLRGMAMGGASVAAVVAITLLRGDLTAADVGIIAAGISGLDAVLKYFIPDKLGPDKLGNANRDDIPPIDLIGKSQAVRPEGDAGLRPSDGAADPEQLRQPVRPVDYPVRHNTDGAADDENNFPGWGS
jgi:hypothetical protein